MQTPAHITLAPPTEVDDMSMGEVLAHLTHVAANSSPFYVRIRGTGTFRPVSPVVFVGVVAGIGGCERLASAVRSGPLRTTPSFPYHPHVTIAHGLDDETLDRAFDEQAGFDAAWIVTSFTLYEHAATDGWTPTRELSLGG
jgi:2'-5' RNA ligase